MPHWDILLKVGHFLTTRSFHRVLGHMVANSAALPLEILLWTMEEILVGSEFASFAYSQPKVKVAQVCCQALLPWKKLQSSISGILMGQVFPHKVIMMLPP